MTAPPILLILLASIVGAVVGSFLAVIAVRWPKAESALWGRSHCDHCEATLRPHNMIPLFSYLAQKGHCSYCKMPIDLLHWKMEFLAAVIAGFAFALAPVHEAIIWCLFGWQLLLLGFLDFRHFWLPDELVLILATTGLALASALSIAPPLFERLVGGAIGFVSLWLVSQAYQKLRGRHGLGAGDPKILGALGCWAGWQALPMLVLLAALSGLVLTIIMNASGQKISGSSRLPLGTLFVVATVPAIFIAPLL